MFIMARSELLNPKSITMSSIPKRVLGRGLGRGLGLGIRGTVSRVVFWRLLTDPAFLRQATDAGLQARLGGCEFVEQHDGRACRVVGQVFGPVPFGHLRGVVAVGQVALVLRLDRGAPSAETFIALTDMDAPLPFADGCGIIAARVEGRDDCRALPGAAAWVNSAPNPMGGGADRC